MLNVFFLDYDMILRFYYKQSRTFYIQYIYSCYKGMLSIFKEHFCDFSWLIIN
jgi:hypothetical protein